MSGTNVIGVWPGSNWLTLSDRPLVIGAHWDVVANTTGFNDNGSGVAVMLELARFVCYCLNGRFSHYGGQMTGLLQKQIE